jgi:hypothetical protein
MLRINFDENVLGDLLGHLLPNSSGHPEPKHAVERPRPPSPTFLSQLEKTKPLYCCFEVSTKERGRGARARSEGAWRAGSQSHNSIYSRAAPDTGLPDGIF